MFLNNFNKTLIWDLNPTNKWKLSLNEVVCRQTSIIIIDVVIKAFKILYSYKKI